MHLCVTSGVLKKKFQKLWVDKMRSSNIIMTRICSTKSIQPIFYTMCTHQLTNEHMLYGQKIYVNKPHDVMKLVPSGVFKSHTTTTKTILLLALTKPFMCITVWKQENFGEYRRYWPFLHDWILFVFNEKDALGNEYLLYHKKFNTFCSY